ncbi:MAG: MCE family protein [Desulfobacter sp.]|nr:MAG: MCE family protein [Desulfobacter sp.]
MKESSSLPRAAVSRKKEISLVWIVPIVALVVGAGLVYKAVKEKGPVAVISFESAEGIEAGKTRVKYKDVDMGKVRAVRLTPGLNGVRVTVDLDREAEGYLTDQTRFWVVRPRLSGTTVSGLSTLLSGAYIAIEPGREGRPKSEFKGLEIPPLVTRDSRGSLFTLKAGELDSLDYGSPVYFRGVKVGQVTGYGLETGGKGVDVQVFINAPHDGMVTRASRFWSASGLDMDLGANGLKINTESLVSILLGGIVLANPDAETPGPPVPAGTVFSLHSSREAAMAKQFSRKIPYLLKFSHSVRGLDIGAPVEFRGFVVGRVADISIEFDSKKNQVLVPVRIEIEEERLAQVSPGKEMPEAEDILEILVRHGMRGQLRTGNLLTGKLYLALDFFENAAPAQILDHGDILEIPTVAGSLEALTSHLSAVLVKLEKLPVAEISRQLIGAVQSVKKAGDTVTALAGSGDTTGAVNSFNLALQKIGILADSLSSELPPALVQARQTLDGVGGVLAKDAAVVADLQRTLAELAEAAKAVRALAEELEQHPESLLRGKEGQ